MGALRLMALLLRGITKKLGVISVSDGVTFQQAAEVFFDPFLVAVDASRNEEARDAVIGLDARWNLLYVYSKCLRT